MIGICKKVRSQFACLRQLREGSFGTPQDHDVLRNWFHHEFLDFVVLWCSHFTVPSLQIQLQVWCNLISIPSSLSGSIWRSMWFPEASTLRFGAWFFLESLCSSGQKSRMEQFHSLLLLNLAGLSLSRTIQAVATDFPIDLHLSGTVVSASWVKGHYRLTDGFCMPFATVAGCIWYTFNPSWNINSSLISHYSFGFSWNNHSMLHWTGSRPTPWRGWNPNHYIEQGQASNNFRDILECFRFDIKTLQHWGCCLCALKKVIQWCRSFCFAG